MIRPLSWIDPLGEQLVGDPLGSDQVDVDHRGPAVLVHVGELLVAGDAGVVHDDVDAAVRGGRGAGRSAAARPCAVMSRVR